MPIYEYRCQDCSQEFERMQRFSDPAVDTCPKCSGPVQRLISRSAFHLKGGGWYVTDYGRNGSSKAEKSAQGDGEKSSKGSESSSSTSSSSESSTSESTSSTTDKPSAQSTASAAA
jgi:putative FmdB family regulatory protein